MPGLIDQVNSSSRNNPGSENIWKYFYMQDRFDLDNLTFTLGLSKILYHTKRK